MHRFIFLGPPAAGKGAQAAKLSGYLSIPHISTGEMLRAVAESGTERGRVVKKYLSSGMLVPDELVTELLMNRLKEADAKRGFILDGYPRTIGQAEALEKARVEIDRVFYFTASDEVLIKRIAGRFSCPSCGAVFNRYFDPPPEEGKCRCGSELIRRSDDTVEVVGERLRQYREKTESLIEYYRLKGVLVEIDSSLSIERVFEAVLSALSSEGMQKRQSRTRGERNVDFTQNKSEDPRRD
ncbi:MAG: adenylate kinase [Planctomycetota bacterium]|nr:adenylate kinase [Planctomycetota bacterium]